MRKTYTKEEKKEYFQGLRDQWKQAKNLSADKEKEIAAIIQNHGLNISITGFVIVYKQMRAQGLKGLPYLDSKTFKGWKENGFKVTKGQKSTLAGITWIQTKNKKDIENQDDENSGFTFPKVYALFHRTQVEAA